LSEDEVFAAFRNQPAILNFGEENIRKKVRFLLDELKLGIHDVIARPVIMGYSLEKCVLPRCAVLSVLMREGKIQRDIKLLPALLAGSSSCFLTRFVFRHADDVPDVVKAYEGKIKFEGFGCDR
jgi:mTERF domain-containing protein